MNFYATPPLHGAFCELVLTHESFAHPVPDTMDLDAAALLEPVSVAVWACRKAAVSPSDRVLAMATALGATRVLHTTAVNPDPPEASEPTVLIECSGHPGALTAGLGSLAAAGRAVLVGMGGDTTVLPVSRIQERELTVSGTSATPTPGPQPSPSSTQARSPSPPSSPGTTPWTKQQPP